jgi:hypothetical protein
LLRPSIRAIHVDPNTHRGNVTPPASPGRCAILKATALSPGAHTDTARKAIEEWT